MSKNPESQKIYRADAKSTNCQVYATTLDYAIPVASNLPATRLALADLCGKIKMRQILVMNKTQKKTQKKNQSEKVDSIQMSHQEVGLDELTVVGISAQTDNHAEASPNGQIPGLWQRFYSEGLLAQIPGATHPGRVVALYTDIESDETGPYTIVIGTTVAPGTAAPEGMVLRTVPKSQFLKFTTPQGPVQQIVMGAWQEIWQDKTLKSHRAYSGDLEIYDATTDPNKAQLDIYISVKA